jgi:hypothetical protein
VVDRASEPGLLIQPGLQHQPAAFAVAHLQFGVVAGDHALDDRQAQAGAVGLAARAVEAGEGAQQLLDLVVRHADAMVADLDHGAAAMAGHFHLAGDVDLGDVCARGLAVAARVLDHVVDHAPQVGGVAHHVDVRLDGGWRCARPAGGRPRARSLPAARTG